MIDKYGRVINYLRVAITDRCNLKCRYCTPEAGKDKLNPVDILTFDELNTIINAFVAKGINKVRLTGGEPLVRKGVIPFIAKLGENKAITDLALTTNGQALKEMALPLKEAGLHRVNISLDTLRPERYKEITRGGDIQHVLEGIQTAIRVGLTPIKINVVLIGGFNEDEIEDFVNWTMDQPISVRFIELMPMGEVQNWSVENFLPTDTVLDRMPALKLMPITDKHAPATYYQLPGALGSVGLISPITCSFCDDCNRLRMTAEGRIKHCLHTDEEFNLKDLIRSGHSIEQFIDEVIVHQPESHENVKDNIHSKTR